MTPSEDPVALSLLPETAAINDEGNLFIGGLALTALAEEFGTPLFVYDEAHLRARCQEAVRAFGPGVAYASKAFLCKAMAQLVAEENMMIDVATAGEFAVARAAGVDPSRIVMHGNNKSVAELYEAYTSRIDHLVVDSFDEIERIAQLSPQWSGRTPQRVYIRVTPGVEAHTHQYVMTGQEDSKFGFSIASGAATQAIEKLREIEGTELVGLHAHIGSQIFRLDVFEQAVGALAPLLERYELPELCLGGGLGVAYLNAEHAPTITEWATTVKAACRKAAIGERVTVTAEPGRSIVAQAGVTCYRVGTMKTLKGIRTYVSVDGGMSDNPRPVLYGSGYEAFVADRADAARPFACRIVGKHCESGDIVVSDARLPADVSVGDVVVTPVTGAYGHAMASNYNRILRPAVVFVRDGQAREVIRRETIEDLLRLEP